MAGVVLFRRTERGRRSENFGSIVCDKVSPAVSFVLDSGHNKGNSGPALRDENGYCAYDVITGRTRFRGEKETRLWKASSSLLRSSHW